VAARATAVEDHGLPIGVLLRLDLAESRQGPDTRSAGRSPGRPDYGWASLTSSERSVAAIIAEGATNREAAAQLFLSRHTIDFHLRQIFRKLGISSRVTLTRLVVQQSATGPARQH
jgi:DNA-binding CsgD family transcriptional regulator